MSRGTMGVFQNYTSKAFHDVQNLERERLKSHKITHNGVR
jgi:hypothetical protein